MKTLIVGGVAGGASCAARLRRLDEQREIIILERGGFVSFANCGLPYYVGEEIKDGSLLTLQSPESFLKRFRIEVRIHSEVIAVEPETKTVLVRDLEKGVDYRESYDQLVLSPGAKSVLPKLPGVDCKGVFTLRSIPDSVAIKEYIAKEKPASAVVVGGGYIGLEMAENLKRKGLRVSVVELADHLLPPLDGDMAADVHRYAREKGLELYLGNRLQGMEETETGLRLTISRGALETELVILAVGVRPDTGFLEGSGIRLTDNGSIAVDRRMQTNLPHIYAVGDGAQVRHFVSGEFAFLPLAGPANKQGRIAADNLCGIPSEYRGTLGASVLKLFDMTVAAAGLNETAAKKAGFDYDKTYGYFASHAKYYPDATMMSVKVLWDRKSLRILGGQIVGFEGVDKRMDVLATAMRLGAKVTDLAELELCYAPPFGSAKDPLNMIGFIGENVATGKLKQFFPEDVASLPRDGSVTLLDTRTRMEYTRGHIPGFMNIPLDELRENLHLIPEGKPVYVHCHSGFRSYIACRILTGNGYDCYNLAGGWRLYDSVVNDKEAVPYLCTRDK
ncbi:MAG: CoA-disulfide reductase [Ruminococcaceae bacterium]|nr:CoA-disulfide reductase [Oscillospiraceae bacterium]